MTEVVTVEQAVEARDENQARELAEFLISDGEVLAWGDRALEDISIDIDEAKGYVSLDYTQADTDDIVDWEV